jgi:hypothetical protein
MKLYRMVCTSSDFVALISGRVTYGWRDLVEGQILRLGVAHGLLELRLEQRTAAGPPDTSSFPSSRSAPRRPLQRTAAPDVRRHGRE